MAFGWGLFTTAADPAAAARRVLGELPQTV